MFIIVINIKSIRIIHQGKISAALDNQTSFTHFKGRHKREFGRSQFASRDKDNGKLTTLLFISIPVKCNLNR